MSGKGSKPRPYSVDRATFDSNWERTFRVADKLVGILGVTDEEAQGEYRAFVEKSGSQAVIGFPFGACFPVYEDE